jgi:response regulator RpfG family c-di-GMP phosphodiesterase
MPESERPRILCVDDEQNVLEGLTRTLRSLYSVETAVGGEQGLEKLKSSGPFAVVTSDLRMPKMSGVEFLTLARNSAPDTVRILLTGYGDMDAAIGAVNDGNIFRFLTKPCSTNVLVKALAASVEQYSLVTSERILLEQTLRGSIKTLTEILALSNPSAFGRATRVQQTVLEIMTHFETRERWPVEVAAMLSQVGFVTLPPQTQERVYKGEALSANEHSMVDRIPHVVEQLLANIPRLEPVREILRFHTRQYEPAKKPADGISAGAIPWGARALRIALDFDVLESEHSGTGSAFDVLRSRTDSYDPTILEAFAEMRGNRKQEVVVHELALREIVAGMVFAEDVKSSKGLLLIARGQEVSPSLLERVRNFSSELGIREPIRMVVRGPAAVGAEPATVAM